MTRIDTKIEKAPDEQDGLLPPGRAGGLVEVFRRRYLLRLLVRKDLKVRYQGSLLGMGWSYIKPGVQFTVYFVVLGIILGLSRSVEDFTIYLFSGLVLFTFFMETFNSTTRSITSNKALVRKLYLPREMFPIASLLVSGFHFLPGLSILIVASLATGWVFSWTAIGAALLACAIMIFYGLAIGLFFSAFNVFFRDFGKIVDVLNLVIRWSAPILYPWTLLIDKVPEWALQIYLLNPLANAVELFHRAFWLPGNHDSHQLFPHMYVRALLVLVSVIVLAYIGQLIFSRLERRFAEELG